MNSQDKKVIDCGNNYFFECPHCDIGIIVLKKEVNCKIFRCGQYIANGHPINPHASEIVCKKLKEQNLIYGCGKPFIFKDDHVEICGYI